MDTHPLSIALSSPIPVSPSFIYLHHPFHSSGYALPASFTNRQLSASGHSNGKDYLDEVTEDEEEEEVGKVVVSVDMGDLGGTGTTTNSLSQKAFYNAVIRQLFTSISATLSLLDQRRSDTAKNATAQNPQLSPNRSRQKGLTGPTTKRSSSLPGGAFASSTAAAAVAAFHEKFAMISQKDVYRWDVFLVRVRAMMNAFHSALSVLPRHSRNGAEGADGMTMSGGGEGSRQVSLTLVVLEAELLQKCLGGTWHAVLRLNEMIETFGTTLVLCSTHAWDDVRPMTGDAPEPYHLFLRAPNKNETLLALSKHNSHPLFPYFLDLLYTACCHLVPRDLVPESERLAKTLWQIYMLPLDGFPHREQDTIYRWDGERVEDAPMNMNVGTTGGGSGVVGDKESDAEPLRITYQLLTDLKNQSSYAFASANESLIPPGRISACRFLDVFTGERKRKRRELEEEFSRAIQGGGGGGEGGGGGGDAWFALANQVRQEQQNQPRPTTDPIIAKLSGLPTTKPPIPKPAFPQLPLYGKYLILAAYCASYNSPRTDLRMFGRGPLTLRGKTRRSGLDGGGAGSAGRGYEGSGSAGKKVGAGLKKTKTLGKAGTKVPQGLLGPKSFPLERMLAVFQSLLAEHGFRADAYHSDEFSDSGSESESGSGSEASASRSEDGGDRGTDAMDTEDGNGPPNSPSRDRSRKRKEASGRDSRRGVLDFSVVDEKAKRIERKRRRENEMLRSWEEEVEEISRSVGLFALIRELEGLRLLNRISPKDRLDNILLRCEAPKEMVFEFARQVKVDLGSYLVEGE